MGKAPGNTISCQCLEFNLLDVLKFNYRCVQLNRLNWKDYLGVLNPVAAALMVRMKMTRDERARLKLECLALLKKSGRDEKTNKLVSWFIDIYLRLTAEEMEEYKKLREKLEPEVKEAVMEMETSWQIIGREEGRKEGRKEGLEQGLRQGMVVLLEKNLHMRFGNLTQEAIDQIHRLDSQKLLKLNEAAFSFRSIADLLNWLAEHSS